jgi:hypothetical protein
VSDTVFCIPVPRFFAFVGCGVLFGAALYIVEAVIEIVRDSKLTTPERGE